MNTDLFFKISNDEYWELMNSITDLSNSEFEKIRTCFQHLLRKDIITNNLSFGIKKYSLDNSDLYKRKEINVDIRNSKNIHNAIIIFKCVDEYYGLRIVTQGNIFDFRCDQFDGLEECIKHCKKLFNFIQS